MRAVLVVTLGIAACGGGLPQPPHSTHAATELVEVPSRPPPSRAENVTDRPDSRAVWIDGEWTWTGRRWSWQRGGWVIPPDHATFTPWMVVVGPDARVFVAPGIWKNANGVAIESPTTIAAQSPAPSSSGERRGRP